MFNNWVLLCSVGDIILLAWIRLLSWSIPLFISSFRRSRLSVIHSVTESPWDCAVSTFDRKPVFNSSNRWLLGIHIIRNILSIHVHALNEWIERRLARGGFFMKPSIESSLHFTFLCLYSESSLNCLPHYIPGKLRVYWGLLAGKAFL